MFFTDAYSTLNQEGLYEMAKYMDDSPTVCCTTGRARVYVGCFEYI